MTQLSLFGVNENQNGFMSTTWGQTAFCPTKDDKWAHNCRLCILNRSEECQEAPCTSEERIDGKRGYFSIHDMPNQQEYN
ncbi:MAG: hypothetical protein K6A94_00995 [Bacteroidales bacterium]|nr:hypothetical protein [Bacteroidales bacterium]